MTAGQGCSVGGAGAEAGAGAGAGAGGSPLGLLLPADALACCLLLRREKKEWGDRQESEPAPGRTGSLEPGCLWQPLMPLLGDPTAMHGAM